MSLVGKSYLDNNIYNINEKIKNIKALVQYISLISNKFILNTKNKL